MLVQRSQLGLAICGLFAVVLLVLPVSAQERHRARKGSGGQRRAMRELVAALVDNSLTVSREADPVRRAGCFRRVAGKLAEEAKGQAASGRDRAAERLSKCCARLIDRGVIDNIDTAQFTDGNGRSKSADALLSEVPKCLDVLRETAAQLPAEQRDALMQAIRASEQNAEGAHERLRLRVQRRERRRGGERDVQQGRGRPAWAGKRGK